MTIPPMLNLRHAPHWLNKTDVLIKPMDKDGNNSVSKEELLNYFGAGSSDDMISADKVGRYFTQDVRDTYNHQFGTGATLDGNARGFGIKASDLFNVFDSSGDGAITLDDWKENGPYGTTWFDNQQNNTLQTLFSRIKFTATQSDTASETRRRR